MMSSIEFYAQPTPGVVEIVKKINVNLENGFWPEEDRQDGKRNLRI